MRFHAMDIDQYIDQQLSQGVFYVDDEEQLGAFCNVLASAIEDDALGAVDLETTWFAEFHNARVRLSQWVIYDKVYVIDHFASASWDTFMTMFFRMGGAEWNKLYCFNNCFENKWFNLNRKKTYTVKDCQNLRKAILGGAEASLSLARLLKMDFNYTMSKDEQKSDWLGEITDSQLEYAVKDTLAVYYIASYWLEEATAGHMAGAKILDDCWRAINQMNETGLLLDVEHHTMLVETWQRRSDVAYRYLRKLTPFMTIANLGSKKQVSDWLKSVLPAEIIENWPTTTSKRNNRKVRKTDEPSRVQDQLLLDRPQIIMAAYSFSKADYRVGRWFAAYAIWTRAQHYLRNYGKKLINLQNTKGGIFPRFNIAAAITLRLSSSGGLNGQNLPNRPIVRKSFKCAEDEKLCIADYSGIEVRTLGELSGDQQLLEDCIFGNVHAESAIVISTYDREEFFKAFEAGEAWAKEKRGKAKPFTFQLTYGAGNATLAMVMGVSVDEAKMFVERWASRYPRAYEYRNDILSDLRRTGKITVRTSHRTIFVQPHKRGIPVAANYPVQGAAAEVIYESITEIEKRYRERGIRAKLAATVHDENLARAKIEHAEEAMKHMLKGMEVGWLKVFPGTETANLIEHAIGDTWAAKS